MEDLQFSNTNDGNEILFDNKHLFFNELNQGTYILEFQAYDTWSSVNNNDSEICIPSITIDS